MVVPIILLNWLAILSAGFYFRAHPTVVKTLEFWKCFIYMWRAKGFNYKDCPYFSESVHAKAHVCSLGMAMKLWSQPHYRNANYKVDLLKNLRNVAIPHTGLPLSFLCFHWIPATLFILFGYPLACVIAALRQATDSESFSTHYLQYLLTPNDWFAIWQMNCRLSTIHSYLTKAPSYDLENKWKFLQAAKAASIPVSPWLEVKNIVVKNANEEGGLGIHFFQSATHGGEWIIQEKLENADYIQQLLPHNAPLSTLRIVTVSYGALDPENCRAKPLKDTVKTLVCVFRAGRAASTTDHNCVLFDVDQRTGKILRGTTNQQWYQRGMKHLFFGQFDADPATLVHPDSQVRITDNVIPDIEKLTHLVEEAHYKLMADVPIAGWDVALTSNGPCILEANLSCNFFQGSYDPKFYRDFVDQCLKSLSTRT